MSHLTHCNQGEYIGGCKYGAADACPALAVEHGEQGELFTAPITDAQLSKILIEAACEGGFGVLRKGEARGGHAGGVHDETSIRLGMENYRPEELHKFARALLRLSST